MRSSPSVWRLKKGFDRRFQSGHPWVFSNELQSSPKGIAPGAPIELQDSSGAFLAHGFGNPQSLIAFREVSRKKEDADWDQPEFLERRLREAFQFRERLGLAPYSFRWIHGESDGLSGLVVDRYVLGPNGKESVIVMQCHSSGMDRISSTLRDVLLKIDPLAKKFVLRNDVSSRKLEGLKESIEFTNGEPVGALQEIWVRGPVGKPVSFHVDLKAGQKTGFFLDQTDNIQRVLTLLEHAGKKGARLKVLDLCTYVGQWSTQIGAYLKAKSVDAEFTLVDISEKALEIAKKNASANGFPIQVKALDVLKSLEQLKETYDVVICDPPALIQNRKTHPQGLHAYQKLNREAMRLTKTGGVLVSCSCSQLLSPEDFLGALAKAEKSSKSKFRWVMEGAQAVDHPLRVDFPEAHYLKMHVGLKSSDGF